MRWFGNRRPKGSARGNIDGCDSTDGLRGWAICLTEPSSPLQLELVVDGQVVATTTTRHERIDVAVALSVPLFRYGFSFDSEIISSLSFASPEALAAQPVVKICDIGTILPTESNVPSLGACVQICSTKLNPVVPGSDHASAPIPFYFANITVRFAIDRVLLIRGFGLVLKGWALPTSLSLREIECKLAGLHYRLDPMSVYRCSRHDLRTLANSESEIFDIAGFVAILSQSDLEIEDYTLGEDIKICIKFTNGHVLHHKLGRTSVEVIDHVRNVTLLREFYPDLAEEPFYGKFCESLLAISRDTARLIPLIISKARVSLVIEFPSDRSDAIFVFFRLVRIFSNPDINLGLTIIIDSETERSVWLPWSRYLYETMRANVSLIRVEGGHVFPLLGDIALLTESESICYCAKGFVPVETAAQSIMDASGAPYPRVAFQAQIDGRDLPEIGMWLESSAAVSSTIKAVGAVIDNEYLKEAHLKAGPQTLKGVVQSISYISTGNKVIEDENK